MPSDSVILFLSFFHFFTLCKSEAVLRGQENRINKKANRFFFFFSTGKACVRSVLNTFETYCFHVLFWAVPGKYQWNIEIKVIIIHKIFVILSPSLTPFCVKHYGVTVFLYFEANSLLLFSLQLMSSRKPVTHQKQAAVCWRHSLCLIVCKYS